ncbi:MAG: hypothetical protein U5P10_13540 [Spirochaetia bacterium]|nr:hypothetical protein [Spirochaetia bacterium]
MALSFKGASPATAFLTKARALARSTHGGRFREHRYAGSPLRLHEDRSEYARQISQKELHGLFCFDSSPLSSYKVLHEKLDSRFAGTWWQGYHNTEVNELISSATATCNADDRQKLYRRAYRILHQEAPWVFLYQPRRFWVAHSSSALTQEHFDDLGFFKL